MRSYEKTFEKQKGIQLRSHLRLYEMFVPASRIEIVQSKMMRGETVPYIKEMNLPWMKYLEVDLNFSLDYKNGDSNALCSMLAMSQKRTFRGVEILTLSLPDFLIHLCGHLYKEATTMAWVKMNRDVGMISEIITQLLLR